MTVSAVGAPARLQIADDSLALPQPSSDRPLVTLIADLPLRLDHVEWHKHPRDTAWQMGHHASSLSGAVTFLRIDRDLVRIRRERDLNIVQKNTNFCGDSARPMLRHAVSLMLWKSHTNFSKHNPGPIDAATHETQEWLLHHSSPDPETSIPASSVHPCTERATSIPSHIRSSPDSSLRRALGDLHRSLRVVVVLLGNATTHELRL